MLEWVIASLHCVKRPAAAAAAADDDDDVKALRDASCQGAKTLDMMPRTSSSNHVILRAAWRHAHDLLTSHVTRHAHAHLNVFPVSAVLLNVSTGPHARLLWAALPKSST